ncbi:hypothetical protein WQ54_21935 [Bacillus sp. SA1-12]|nr:hypothetical protein WQ54_21935 [Bacillus sp. SA1-12]
MQMKFTNRLSIATKHFIFLFISTLMIFVTLIWNNQQDSIKLFRNQVIYDSQKLLENTNLFLNSYLENIQSILLDLSMKDELLLTKNEEAINNELRTTADINSSLINAIYMISTDGKVYSSHKVYYEILGNPQISYLYQLSQKNYGGINWSEPYHSPLSAGNTVAFVSPIKNKNTFIGTVVIEIDLEQLSRKLTPMLLNKNQSFIILTSSGNIVSTDIKKESNIPQDLSDYPRKPSKPFIQNIKIQKNGVHDLAEQSMSLVSVKSDQNRLGWSLISLIDKNVFYENVNILNENFKKAGVFLVVILFISTFMLSRYLTKPIRKLAKKMDTVTSLQNMSTIEMNRSDEIGSLARSYNAMIDRIQFLFKENARMEDLKKEYEFKMLQSQIKPHFLYNTLACIGSLARQNKTEEVRGTIRSLVGLLSFSFDKRSEMVSLTEEVESVEMYFDIQRMRYGNKFTLSVAVDVEAFVCKVPRLTLQPFVENAIFHGISTMEGKGEISIKGTISGGMLKLYIRDNGVGMEQEKVNQLLNESIKRHVTEGFNSIGMVNVHERIRLHYGSSYGIRVKSLKNVGTIVKITIPCGNDESVKDPTLGLTKMIQ